MANDLYGDLTRSPLGKRLVAGLGLPSPERLRRYTPGDALVEGPVVVGGHGAAPLAKRIRDLLGALHVEVLTEAPTTGTAAAVIADLTDVEHPEDLESLRALVGPALTSLGRSARVVVLGRRGGPEFLDSELARLGHLVGLAASIARDG